MKLSTQTIAAAGTRHPWRTIAAWIASSMLAVVPIAMFLDDSLTSEGAPTNNPQSERAEDAIARAFQPDPQSLTTDVIVVRSEQYTVEGSEPPRGGQPGAWSTQVAKEEL